MLKNKFTITFVLWLAILLVGLISVSCSSDGEKSGDGLPSDMCADFATFENTSGNGSVFTLRKSGDSELITLTAPVRIDVGKIKPETRLIIYYTPSGGQMPYESGPIDLYGITAIQNGTPEPTPLAKIESWTSQSMKMVSLTRSGEYLDVWAELSLDARPERFTLALDEATADSAYPELYLVFTSDSQIGRVRQYYASFDLSDIWDLASCEGVKIRYLGGSGEETVTFSK